MNTFHDASAPAQEPDGRIPDGPSPISTAPPWIEVVRARTHNLQDVSVRIPRGRLVAFSGVSGSGKTSLAMDTINSEAQLRYLEGLSPFVRRFISPRDRPQVDRISGLTTTLAVDQRKLNRNARSTLATITGIDAYLSLLFSRMIALDGNAPDSQRALSSGHFDRYSPEGGCPTCHGAGATLHSTPDLIITDPDLPLLEGASPWFNSLKSPEQVAMKPLAEMYGVDIGRPWRELPEEFRNAVLYGTGDRPVAGTVNVPNKKGDSELVYKFNNPLRGALAEVERLFGAAGTDRAKERYLPFMKQVACRDCAGSGYGEAARSASLNGATYADMAERTVAEVRSWVDDLGRSLTPVQAELGDTLLPPLISRLRMLERLGLGHVQIGRSAPSLSGGELQRSRVAAQLGTELTGIIFILDEPSAGLHPVDKAPLSEILRELRDAGNTVLFIDHDPDLIAQADHVIDIGPGPGRHGGRVVAQGTPEQVRRTPGSVTAQYLSGEARVLRKPRPVTAATTWLEFGGVNVHNVRQVDIRIPTNRLTCITGVSGSGKSTVLNDAVAGAVSEVLAGRRPEHVERVDLGTSVTWQAVVDQDPIGRTPRSTPATYTKAFDVIRRLFAGTDAAKSAGLTASAFSFNGQSGRCHECSGYGRRQVDMHFLPDVWVTCEACEGRRFEPEVLAVRYQGLRVDEVLDLSVDDAEEFFASTPSLRATLEAMRRCGLGYLTLGQSATELSGGEAQRLKLSNAILRGSRSGGGLVVLDEPVTGLHPADVQRMVDAFDVLLDSGNTVLIAEHDLHVASRADWVIDMGPGGGEAGGRVVSAGPPEDVAAGTSPSAPFLRAALSSGDPTTPTPKE